jgi:hypothetical protein
VRWQIVVVEPSLHCETRMGRPWRWRWMARYMSRGLRRACAMPMIWDPRDPLDRVEIRCV